MKNITFIFNNIIGGVATMNIKIIEHANLLNYFNVKIILINCENTKHQKILTEKWNQKIEVFHFNYNYFDNHIHVLKKLHNLIETDTDILVTNDGIELESIKKYGSRRLVYHIVHDLYNFKLAINNSDIIDFFICHTSEFSRLLKSSPDLHDRVFYLPFGVNIDKSTIVDIKKEKLTIISLSRLVKSKGVHHLIKIEDYLFKNMVDVHWIIIGDGPEKKQIADQWNIKNNVSFYSPSDEETVRELLRCSDLFISLSEFEGYGISLLEAMSNGLVPIITKLPIGIHSIIDENIGYCEEGVDINMIGQFIIRLSQDINLLNRLKKKSLDFILNNFNAKNTGKCYLRIFLLNNTKSTQFSKRVVFKQFGLLDHKLIPNILSRILKRIKYAIG